MPQSELILFIIKMVLGAVASFFAILLWSKTRDIAWMCLVAGTITNYAGIVYEMMNKFGILGIKGITVFSIPLTSLLFTIIPQLFIIIAFIIMLFRTRH